MKIHLAILISILFVFSCTEKEDRNGRLGHEVKITTHPDSKLIDAEVRRLIEKYQLVSLSLAVVSPDTLYYCKSFGFAALGDERPMLPQTYIRVASISKWFVSLAVLKLQSLGLLSLHTSIDSLLGIPFFHPIHKTHSLQLGYFLSHRSGLSGDETIPLLNRPPRLDLGWKENFGDAFVWHNDPPNQRFEYSNAGFGIVAMGLERMTGLPFDVLMRKMIFFPLQLQASFNPNDFIAEQVSIVYRSKNGQWVAEVDSLMRPPDDLTAPPGTNGFRFSPMGGLRISLKELAHVAMLYLNGFQSIPEFGIRPALLQWWENQHFSTNEKYFGRYGYGVHHTYDIIEGEEFFGHPGEAYGVLSGMYFHKNKTMSVIWIINGHSTRAANGEFYDEERELFQLLKRHFLTPN